MKILIAGGRTYSFTDNDIRLLDKLHSYSHFTEEVTGLSEGADTEGMNWAIKNNITVKRFPADWSKYAKGAGPKRNAQMADYLTEEDYVVLFPGGKGTKHMKNIAEKRGLRIIDFGYKYIDNIEIHPNGNLIFYNDKEHKYWTNTCDKFTSVTTFIDKFFVPFDSQKISYYYAKKHKLSQKDVLAMWAKEGYIGGQLGSNIHYFNECYLQKLPLPKPINKKEYILMEKMVPFLELILKNYEVVACEKIIFSEELKLSGTVDLLLRHKATGKLHIVDWKTNKQIKIENKYRKFGLDPIKHIPDTNYYHYCLQTSLYKYMLLKEGYYDEEIGTSIVHIHLSELRKYKMKYYETEIKNMIKQYLNK